MISFLSTKKEETIRFGARLAKLLKKGDIVCLFGDLGSGKTTFTKGIAKGLGIKEALVNSPTFVLMNEYDGKIPLFHFDLYRVDNTKEISAIGYEDFFYDNGITVVEWADKLGELLPKDYIKVEFSHKNENKRGIRCSAVGRRAKDIIAGLKK